MVAGSLRRCDWPSWVLSSVELRVVESVQDELSAGRGGSDRADALHEQLTGGLLTAVTTPGETAGHAHYMRLLNGQTRKENRGELESIAHCLTSPGAVFVSADKQALMRGLAELGPSRAVLPLELAAGLARAGLTPEQTSELQEVLWEACRLAAMLGDVRPPRYFPA
jgi:hypothetical protein